MLVTIDGLHPPVTQQGTIGLYQGKHELVVEFFERSRGDSLPVEWQGPGFKRVAVPVDILSTVCGLDVDGPGAGTDTARPSTPGINYQYFEGVWSSLPDFDALTPASEGQSNAFSLDECTQDDDLGFGFTTYQTLSVGGQNTFYTCSDDGGSLSVNNKKVVVNDGLHADRERFGEVTLAAGTHAVRVDVL